MPLIDYSTPAGDEYHRQRRPELFDNPKLFAAWGEYARKIYFHRVPAGGKVLEVGAGLGNNLVGVKKSASVYATEPAKIAREYCFSLGIQVFPSLTDIAPELRFDAILLRHVLEHVPEPRALLCQLRPSLKEGGELVIVLPTESPYAPIRSKDLDHHLYCWNRQTLKNLLNVVDYEIVEAKINWFNGRRIFLPLFQFFGADVYCLALTLLGRLRGCSEIVAFAKPKIK